MLKDALKSRQQRLDIKQVRSANPGACRLIGVSGADTLARRADCVAAACLLGEHVQGDMIGHDEVSAVTDHEPVPNVEALLTETVYLVEQHIGIDDYTIADDIHRIGPEHTAGNEMEAELPVLVDHGMAGIVAA